MPWATYVIKSIKPCRISVVSSSLTFLQNNFGGQKTLNQLDDAAKLLTDMRSLGQTLDLNVADVNNIASIARPILNALDATPSARWIPTASTPAVSSSASPTRMRVEP